MKIALLADLHGNMPATRAMEQALEKWGADELWFLGDAVGKGPESRDTCDWVRRHCSRFVGGNWDYGVGFRSFPADVYYWDQLGEERLQWLRELPWEMEATVSGVRFRLFHGRPVTGLMYAQSDEAVLQATFRRDNECFGGVIFADSHRPFIRTLSEGYIINTGSVGNGIGIPKAHALLLEGEPDSEQEAPLFMSILSVPYDRPEAIRIAQKEINLPRRDAYIREIETGIYSR